MGQQQLLLLVLGIVIVGIAVVAGITAFTEGKNKADRDAAVADAMRIVSDVQAWKLKPGAYGGGANGTASFAGVSFMALGISPNSGTQYKTSSGCFSLAGTSSASTITVYQTDCTTTIATVVVTGTTTQEIAWSFAAS